MYEIHGTMLDSHFVASNIKLVLFFIMGRESMKKHNLQQSSK